MVLHWHIIDELIVLRDFKLGVLAEIHHLFDAVFVCACVCVYVCVCARTCVRVFSSSRKAIYVTECKSYVSTAKSE